MDNVSIYVLPTEEGQPPRAVLFDSDTATPESMDAAGMTLMSASGVLATWVADDRVWRTEEGEQVPDEVAEAITEHARNLGVETFTD